MTRIAFVLALALLPTLAHAQQRPANYMLTVTNEELLKIAAALGAMPYREVAPLIAKLQGQVSEQEKPAEKKD